MIATAVGGMTDIIRNGIDGSLVLPGDPAALCTAITSMFEDSAYRESCIMEAHKRVESLFGIDLAVQRYEECLTSVLSAGN